MMSANGTFAGALRVATLLVAFAPPALFAQGTLSTQGLGFPPGQLSTVAQAVGGAIGESDAHSPLNPAALSLLPTSIIWLQAEPEYRSVTLGGVQQRTSIARFPLFLGGLPLGSRWALGISASTLLDRTWATTTRDSQVLASDTLRATIRQRSEGSIADLRVALSFATTSWLRIGVGAHAFTGRDALETIRAFDDTVRFARDTQQNTVTFGGNAISVGGLAIWPRTLAVGASYRRGGGMRTYSGGDVVDRASAPDHFGVSASYLGISGTTLSIRAAKDTWSRLKGISQSLNVHEGLDIGVGGDVAGPQIGSSPLFLRAGARWRTLPFSPTTSPVKENTISTGLGFRMARDRAELNFAALRAARTNGMSGATENAWTFSTGFAVRP